LRLLVNLYTAYETLGFDSSRSSPDAVRSAFRALILKNHPDVFQEASDKVRANERTRLIVEAFQALKAAGFPRLTSYAASEQASTAAAAPTWQPQHDEGDEEFDRWERSLFEAMYAGSIKRSGHAGTLAKTLWMGLWGLAWGIGILVGGIVTLAGPVAKRNVGQGVGLVVFGLVVNTFALRYMASPAFYYRKRDQRKFSLQQWPSSARWTLLVPTAIAAWLLGTFGGGLPGQILAMLFRNDFTILNFVLGWFFGPAFMVASVRYVAPRFKTLAGLVAASCASLFAIGMLTLEYISGAHDVREFRFYTVASIIGSVVGLLPKAREHDPSGASSVLRE
jgi:hypothetical protein